MKLLSPLCLIPALAAVALLTGCDSWSGYRHVHYDPNNQPPAGSDDHAPPPSRRDDANDANDADGGRHVREVRGTIESVDPGEQAILIRPGDGGGDRDGRDGRDDRDIVIHYDEDTQVEFQGRTFGVESLERGDQISAAVERGSEGLLTRAIRVLHDVRGGEGEDMEGGRGEEPGAEATEVRGVVRSNNSSHQTLEVEQAGSHAMVVVGYDDDTDVEFQGRHYSPDNLEKGDAVEIELREEGGQPVADHILVVGEGRPVRT
jgi:cold shock CspA family protein